MNLYDFLIAQGVDRGVIVIVCLLAGAVIGMIALQFVPHSRQNANEGIGEPFLSHEDAPLPPSLAGREYTEIPAFLRATAQSPLQVLAAGPGSKSELAQAYESLQVLSNHAEAVSHEHSRLLDALQDAVILLHGKPAEWKGLAPEYGIDPNSNTLPASLKAAALADFEQLISEVLAGEPAKAVAA